jgi:transitional endoplasmic reticulum ATPase
MLAATQSNKISAISAFNAHSKAQRVETKTTTLNLIRAAYPDYHVTEVDEGNVSLREYAATDAASMVLDAEDDTFMSTRQWEAVGEGIEKVTHPGELKDESRFAR